MARQPYFDRRRAGWLLGRPVHGTRAIVGGGAVVVGGFWLVATDADPPLGWAVMFFGVYTLLALGLVLAISSARPEQAAMTDAGAPETARSDDDEERRRETARLNDQAIRQQSVVLTLTGTVLGLLTAFASGPLAPSTRAAVVSLVAAALVQIAAQASDVRTAANTNRMLQYIAVLVDFAAVSLFAFGLISLAASLVTRSSP